MPLAVSVALNSGTAVIGAVKQLAELPVCVYEKCWRDACQIQLEAVSAAASSSLIVLLCVLPFRPMPRRYLDNDFAV